MALNLHPDPDEAQLMVEELGLDIECDCFTCSPRLTPLGCQRYPGLVEECILTATPADLERILSSGRWFRSEELAHSRNGMAFMRRINHPHAAKMLSEGTWNNLWCRSQCRQAINWGTHEVEVFRAATRHEPRPESERMVGQVIDADELLENLRGRACDHTTGTIPVPGGPMSGISVRTFRPMQP